MFVCFDELRVKDKGKWRLKIEDWFIFWLIPFIESIQFYVEVQSFRRVGELIIYSF